MRSDISKYFTIENVAIVTLATSFAILAAAATWYWYAGVNAASGETYITEAAKRSDIVVTVTATGTALSEEKRLDELGLL